MNYFKVSGLNPHFLSDYYVSGSSVAWHMCRGNGKKYEYLQSYLATALDISSNWDEQKLNLKNDVRKLFNKNLASDIYLKLSRFLGKARFYKRNAINSCVEFAELVGQSELMDRYSISGISLERSHEYLTYAGSQKTSLKRIVIACPDDEKIYTLPIWAERESVVWEINTKESGVFSNKFPVFKFKECKSLSPLNEIYEGKLAKEFDKTLFQDFTDSIDHFDFLSYSLSDLLLAIRSIRLENFVTDPMSTKEPYLSFYGLTFGCVTKEEKMLKDTFSPNLIRLYLDDGKEKSATFFFYLSPSDYNYLYSSFKIKTLNNCYLGILFKLLYTEKIWTNKIELVPLRIWILDEEDFFRKVGLANIRFRRSINLDKNNIQKEEIEVLDSLVRSKRIEKAGNVYIYSPKIGKVPILIRVNPIFKRLVSGEDFKKIFVELKTESVVEKEEKIEREEYGENEITDEVILLLRIMSPNTLKLPTLIEWLSYFFPERKEIASNLIEPLIRTLLRKGIIIQKDNSYTLKSLNDKEMEKALLRKQFLLTEKKFKELERFVRGIICTHAKITKDKIIDKIIKNYQLPYGLRRKIDAFLSLLEEQDTIIIDDSGIVFT